MKTINDGWQSYRDAVIPPTASPVQFQECERTWYASAAHFFEIVARLAELPEEEAIQAMSALEAELQNYMLRLAEEVDPEAARGARALVQKVLDLRRGQPQ